MEPIDRRIAQELGVRAQQVAAAISLLDSGATVPFVARYRKEATGALDDTQLRRLEDLYLPYRPKRRTKAQIAREAGLAELAEALLARPIKARSRSLADMSNRTRG
jgi:protein Tex